MVVKPLLWGSESLHERWLDLDQTAFVLGETCGTGVPGGTQKFLRPIMIGLTAK